MFALTRRWWQVHGVLPAVSKGEGLTGSISALFGGQHTFLLLFREPIGDAVLNLDD